jgi:hypothetical protein
MILITETADIKENINEKIIKSRDRSVRLRRRRAAIRLLISKTAMAKVGKMNSEEAGAS